MMQWESIQKYRTPSRSAHMTASLNVLGKSSRVILHIPSKALFDKVRGIPWVSTPVVAQSHVCRRPDIVTKASAVTCPCLLSFISRNLTGSSTGCAGNPIRQSRTPQPTSAIEAAAADMDPCLLVQQVQQTEVQVQARSMSAQHFAAFLHL